MTSYEQHFTEDRRLSILKLLAAAPEYTANEFLLQSALANHGHSVALDRVRTDLAWLKEQDLLDISKVGEMTIAKLSSRGGDVAAGRSTVPGVKRPAPGL